ncbi:Zn-dependent exopeptidase M28 [candidate division WOR-3 bacterium]|nr:Zn-dependent exopeptidase M28 [candidate division WOR-3 bacterium]
MSRTALACLLLAVVAGAAPAWLCRVELERFADARAVAATGARVVMCLDGYCLVQVDASAIQSLERAGLGFELLDVEPRDKSYVYVMPAPGFDRRVLARHGRVLTEDPEGVVLATDADGILELNRLPVELAGVGNEPMPLAGRASALEPLVVPDSLVRELVGRVSPDTLETQLLRMREFRTRYSTTDSCRSAVEWFRQRLAAFGCDSTYLDTFRADYAPSAIGVKTGTLYPDEVFVVMGHVDATSQQPQTNTPGSEDNASGAGAVLELARVMRDMSFQKTVWFIGFSGEEQGLVGSDSFARHAHERGDSILLAVNFDMISYSSSHPDWMQMYGCTEGVPSVTWLDSFLAQADTFTDLQAERVVEGTPARRSDHYSFWKYGFPFIRGGYKDRTPHYHTIGDTIGPPGYVECGTNNIPMYAEVVKALVATVAKLAGAEPMTGVKQMPNVERRMTNGPTVMRAAELARLGGRVFDSHGREVGEHRESLAAGVYFLCRKAGGATGRVMVVR